MLVFKKKKENPLQLTSCKFTIITQLLTFLSYTKAPGSHDTIEKNSKFFVLYNENGEILIFAGFILYTAMLWKSRRKLYLAARALRKWLQAREFQNGFNLKEDWRGTRRSDLEIQRGVPMNSHRLSFYEETRVCTIREALKSLYRGGISRWNNKQQLKARHV